MVCNGYHSCCNIVGGSKHAFDCGCSVSRLIAD